MIKQINSFFDITNNICKKTGDIKNVPGFSKHMSKFMILRHLSCNVKNIEYIKIAQEMDKGINSNQMYDWLYKVIPKYNGFLKYDIGKKK